jgi:ribonuclease HI
MDVIVATDGGCSGNGTNTAVATWGFCVLSQLEKVQPLKDAIVKLGGSQSSTDLYYHSKSLVDYEEHGIVDATKITATNNRGELTALLKGLQWVEKNMTNDTNNVTVLVDSTYCMNTVDKWMDNWFLNPKKYKLETRPNLDLLTEIKKLLTALRTKRLVKFMHINSHTSAPHVESEQWIYWMLNNRVDRIQAI